VNVTDVAECYEKHSEALVRFAATQVGWSDADDVVATAVLGVLARPRPGIDDLRAYLYRAVANAALKHWRSLERRARREAAFAPAHAMTLPDVEPEILGALKKLSPQQRAVVHLTYWEDLTPATVADRLGISDGSVRRQLNRARRRLAEVLDEQR
jgi:RNA polymerase sigma-70 factor (ECF subfamily)